MKLTLDEQQQIVLAHAGKRAPHPILSGEVALLLGWWATLQGTEHLLDQMVTQGKLRSCTKAECRQYDIRHGYVLV